MPLSFLMILVTINNQIIYIEWARESLIYTFDSCKLFLLVIFWRKMIIMLGKHFYFFYFQLYFWFCTTFIFIVPLDLSLFFGERRGYIAQEFLLFGRQYEFSMGVTHLNMYIKPCYWTFICVPCF